MEPNLRNTVYCTAVREGNEHDWIFLYKQFLKTNVASEKGVILYALGCSREVWVLQRYLDWILDKESNIRKQDSFSAFAAVAHNDIGFPLAKSFLIDRIDEIHELYGYYLAASIIAPVHI